MLLTRTVRHGCTAVLIALVGTAGCGRAPSTAPSKPGDPAPANLVGPGSPGGPKAVTAGAFAADFLDSVKAGTATPARLTPAFKGVVAEPSPSSAADREAGFSEYDAGRWLKKSAGTSFDVDGTPVFTAGEVTGFRGVMSTAEGEGGTFAVRLAKTGDGWAVDWFSPVGPPGVTVPASDVPAAGFVAAAFLDAVTAGAEPLAAGLMTLDGKARVAHPFASDKDRGYNHGLLRRRLGEFRRGATGYTIRVIAADGPGRPWSANSRTSRSP